MLNIRHTLLLTFETICTHLAGHAPMILVFGFLKFQI